MLEEANPTRTESLERYGGRILRDVLRTILLPEIASVYRSALMKFLLHKSQLYHLDIMDGRLCLNLTGSTEHDKQPAGCLNVYIAALHMEKGPGLVTDVVTNLFGLIIQANKNLEAVSPWAVWRLKERLGPMRSAHVSYVAEPDADGLFPCTVLCLEKGQVLGIGHGMEEEDARLRAAMAAGRKCGFFR